MRRKLEFLFPSSVEGGNEGSGYRPDTEERIPLSIAVWKSAAEEFGGGDAEEVVTRHDCDCKEHHHGENVCEHECNLRRAV